MNWATSTWTGTLTIDRQTPTPAGATYDAATLAWEAAVGAINVSPGRKTLIDALIKGLKTDGVWAKLDRLWIFRAENSTCALTDLKALDVATAVNSPTFTPDRGYAGNGTTSYINTTYNPSTDGVNFTGISACGGIWNNTSSTASATANPLGGQAGTVYTVDLLMRYTDNNTYGRIVSTSGAQVAGAYSGPGLFMMDRSNAFAANLYKNGTSIGSSGGGSAALQSVNIFVGAESNAGTPQLYSSDQIAFAIFGGSLTGTEHGNLYTRLNTYVTATP